MRLVVRRPGPPGRENQRHG